MDTTESMAEANRLLAEAGWHPHPDWGGAYAKQNLVGGIYPDKSGCEFKDWTKIPPGHPLHSADTPDEPHEAAAWLANRFKPMNVMSMASLGEAAYGGGHDSDAISETDGHSGVGEAAPQDQFAESDGGAQGGSGGGGDGGDSDFLVGTSEPDDLGAADDSFDLGSIEDYTPDPALLEGADATDAEFSEPEEEPDEAASQFIFGDGLYQMRVAAIGLVTVKAASLMPDVDLVRLSELRNFAMGVSEKRWDDDAAKREELDTLEATARLANAIAKARDDKAAYLLDATREQVEAFDVEANWP